MPVALPLSGRVSGPGGVEIAYADRGHGDLSIVFIHGGFAHRGFWREPFMVASAEHRVVAVDLAGHGESGRIRSEWSIPAFAGDVVAVADALRLEHMILVGNSLGGPVALEAAARLHPRVRCVVGVDTFHLLTAVAPAERCLAHARAWSSSPDDFCTQMVEQLFHPHGHVDLRRWVKEQMLRVPVDVGARMLESFSGYDPSDACRRAAVPVRSINGDLWTTRDLENRDVVPDFSVVVMPETGHFPMLERPDEFSRELLAVVNQYRTDCRLTECANLRTLEASLTGEPEPVD